jgi:uncharacterized repeat protein (TIGR03803 family)
MSHLFRYIGLICAAGVLSAQTFTTLATFNGTNGTQPNALVQGLDGHLYGTTAHGGTSNNGTVFKFTSAGALTTIVSFAETLGGAGPADGLLLATDGSFYGTTVDGGMDTWGSVFKFDPDGTLTILQSFDGTNGAFPYTGLVEGADGDLYGTTTDAGPAFGNIFKITLAGTLTNLDSFYFPTGTYGRLVQATDGNFYGPTLFGATIFKMTPSGTLTTLYSFCSQSECETPYAGLVQAANLDLYGTTTDGGTNGAGTVFKISLSGTLTTLYSFCSQSACEDGSTPYAGLVEATDGNLYGVTSAGGTNNSGTIFRITPDGELTTLHAFVTAGGGPTAVLLQATDGNFYGTTQQGGTGGAGTVFRLSVGLGPFVKTLPHIGQVGAAIQILGTDLASTTSVSFNGTPAAFTIDSPTLITTTVPAEATTGYIQVTTSSGTLFSGGPFLVRQ